MIIAVDAGVRLVRCYSLLSRRIETLGTAVVAVVSDTGLVDVTPPIFITTPETREYEVEILRHYSHRADVCVLDGIPEKICKRNLGIIKTGNAIRGWTCRLWGPYAICGDFEADDKIATTAIKLNNVAHNIVHHYAKLWFKHELFKKRCITPEGAHPVPDLNYFK